jgi:hypothetical protein
MHGVIDHKTLILYIRNEQMRCEVGWSKRRKQWTERSLQSPAYLWSRVTHPPWRLRRYVPPKRRFEQQPHGATSQKRIFFIIIAMKTLKSHTVNTVELLVSHAGYPNTPLKSVTDSCNQSAVAVAEHLFRTVERTGACNQMTLACWWKETWMETLRLILKELKYIRSWDRQTDRRYGMRRAEGGTRSADGGCNYKTQHTGYFISFTKMASWLTCCLSKEQFHVLVC